MFKVHARYLHFLNRTIKSSIKLPEYALNPSYSYPFPEKTEKFTQKDIDKIRTVSKIVAECLESLSHFIKPGITTDKIDDFVFNFAMDKNVYPTPLGFKGFPRSCVTSVNEIICHGIPSARILMDGDIISVDVSFYKNGFHGDSCKSYLVGADIENHPKKNLIKHAYDCSLAGVDAVQCGKPYLQVGKAISQKAIDNGVRIAYGICGHGLGSYLHGPPQIGHTIYDCQDGVFEENSVFTIEPCIVEGNGKDFVTNHKCLEDRWSLITGDGACGSQFEHVVLVLRDSIEILSKL